MLEFAGHLEPRMGLLLAAVFALGTWLVYRRETKGTHRFAFVLPLLRVLVVACIILMLTGPTLRHRTQIGEPGRVIVFIDGSDSMAMMDTHMEMARKVLIARNRGWLSEDAIDISLYETAQMLRDARLNVDEAIAGRDKLDVLAITKHLNVQLAAALAKLRSIDLATLPAPSVSATGGILREYWLDLPGDKLTDLTASQRLLGPPSGSHTAGTFEAPPNLGDNYGTRLRGFLHPPITGAYTLWIASAGPSELWLSDSENPTGKRRIARVTTATKPREWKSGESQSSLIGLEGGKRYYIEAIHKAGTGEDHLAVGWQLSIGSVERPIPGKRLSPVASIVGQTPEQQRDILAARFQAELLDPLLPLLSLQSNDRTATQQEMDDLAAITSVAQRWETTLQSAFEMHAKSLVQSDSGPIATAMRKVDADSRWSRAKALLTSHEGLIRTLFDKHQIEIYMMKQSGAELLWSSAQAGNPPTELDGVPDATLSDLAVGLDEHATSPVLSTSNAASAAVLDEPQQALTSVIVLSDGQHNVNNSDPQAVAALLGERRIPIYTVGLGSLTRPEDLSIRSVDAPQSVFYEDRVQGEIVIDDDMPPGQPFTVRIEMDEKTLWQQTLITERANMRRVPFDFAVKQLVERQAGLDRDVKLLNVPLKFQVSLSTLDGESEKGNNTAPLTVQAVTEPRRILIIDGRPRWESRYLRNLFSRDQRWQVNAVFAGTNQAMATWRRGEESGAFPRDLQTLYKYDVIIFGDAPASLFTAEEIEHLRDFVGERGGGMIFIDGQRGHLRSFAATPLADLIPVQWTGNSNAEAGLTPARLKLSAAGQAFTPLRILSDPLDNAALWQELMPPHWLAPVRELPGSQVLVQGATEDQIAPALVERSYGAGKVIYLAFDESWRWRYEVGDVYHGRFWNQIARHVGEQPYAVQDQFVKLDAGNATYQPGEKAQIRARLRDREGKPMLAAKVDALVMRDGRKIATIPLEVGEGKSGSFRGETSALEPGKYEIALSVAGMNDSDLKARAKFEVTSPMSEERKAVVMDEDTLKRMAQRSFGRYYREEEMPDLIKRLEPVSRGRIVVSETALWRSYWWFVPIMVLLTLEWLLRKRAGLL